MQLLQDSSFLIFGVSRLNRRALKHELILEHQHAEKLEELNKMKSHFFANITHEFRSPLTLIMGPLQQFVSGELKEGFQEIVRMTLRNSRRMYHLINQILELSKLETGYIKLQAQKLDIIPVIENIMRLYTSFAESKNINMQFTAHDDFKTNTSSIELYVDVDKIQKVIINLLSNALKYTPQHGNVSISIKKVDNDNLHQKNVSDQGELRRTSNIFRRWIFPRHKKANTETKTAKSVFPIVAEHGYLEICVKDNGIGIQDKDLNKIFDRFYQGIDPHSGAYDSVGIGLALTKELVELHSGTIHVKSVCEQGTEFFVRLPLGNDHLLPSEIIQYSDNRVNSLDYDPDEIDENFVEQSGYDKIEETDEHNGQIILIVDDNADIRKYVVDHLKNEYRIITAKDGLEGLEKAKNQIPDLIVSDINMPRMNGIDLCTKIRTDELTCHIPIILLTVRASKDAKIEGLEIGADDYITKPFEIRELKARIRNLFEQRRQLMKKFNREHGFQPSEITSNSIDEQLLNKALSIVELNISESMFGVEELSKQMSISRSQLYRKILAITGQTPVEFIRLIRLNRAAQLLKQKHDNIGRIAYEVGFSNPSYFSNSFYKQFGMYPSEYVKQFK